MWQAVTSALAGALNLLYISVAAKTGTAETGVRNQYDNSWVTDSSPYEHPQYAFVVVLERGPAGSGSQAGECYARTLDSLYAENSPTSAVSGSHVKRSCAIAALAYNARTGVRD